MSFIITKPDNIVSAIKKLKNKGNVAVRFYYRILWINNIPIIANCQLPTTYRGGGLQEP